MVCQVLWINILYHFCRLPTSHNNIFVRTSPHPSYKCSFESTFQNINKVVILNHHNFDQAVTLEKTNSSTTSIHMFISICLKHLFILNYVFISYLYWYCILLPYIINGSNKESICDYR